MVDYRTALAAVLGVGLGLVLVAFPEFVVRVHTTGRMPQDRHGDYGESGVDGKYRRIVQVVGVAVVAAGLYFGATLVM